ncbi:MAG: alpha/beta hydrolase [Robiginitomaculum sp.]|nr:MAG: alpha/beta hydrolase [Robiginitomaculum sp.]
MKKFFWIALAVILIAVIAGWVWVSQKSEGNVPAELEARYLTADDRFIEIDGARVRVRIEGPDQAPVLVLLHGFSYSLESWDGWVAELQRDFRIVRYDLLGHGLTGPDPKQRYTPQQRAFFLEKLLDSLELKTVNLAGNSLGGTIAWRFAAQFPDRVEKLILVDGPAFAFNAVHDEPVKAPAAMAAFLRFAPMSGLKQAAVFLWADPSRLTDTRLQSMQDMMLRQGNADALIAHIAMFTMPDPLRQLAWITAPTLVLWGGQDRLIPPAQGQQIVEAIQDARFVLLEDVGHMGQEEKPVKSAQIVRDFLTARKSD